MKDYSDIGLTPYIQKDNSLSARDSGFVDNYKLSQNYSYPTEALRYTNMNRLSRQYMAVCTPRGEGGTFKDIQLAINYVNELGGGNVMIKEGRYVPGESIILYSNIKLIGDGPGKTIIELGDQIQIKLEGTAIDLSNLMSYSSNALQNVSIENIQIDQNKTTESDSIFALSFRYIRNLNIRDCLFNAIGDYPCCGIQISVCIPSLIENNSGVEMWRAIDAGSGNYIIRNNSFVASNDYDGFDVIRITGSGNSNRNTICDNYVENCPTGISLKSASNCHVYDNHLNGNNRSGDEIGAIFVNKSSGGVSSRNITIKGNIAVNFGTGVGSYGISVDYSDYINIFGNIVDGNNPLGVDIGRYGTANHIQVIGNSVDNCDYGIYITGADRTLINGNDAQGCGTAIVDNGTNTTSANNIVA